MENFQKSISKKSNLIFYTEKSWCLQKNGVKRDDFLEMSMVFKNRILWYNYKDVEKIYRDRRQQIGGQKNGDDQIFFMTFRNKKC